MARSYYNFDLGYHKGYKVLIHISEFPLCREIEQTCEQLAQCINDLLSV